MAQTNAAAAWPEIVALGEPMIEFNQTDPDSPNYVQGFGGDVSNMAIAAARQGARVGVITRVGVDPFGDLLMTLWQSEGVDTRAVARDSDAHTGIYFVSHTVQGHAFHYLRAGSAASRISPATLPREFIQHAVWLHVSAISQAISTSACEAVFAAIEIAKTAGVKVTYDANLRLKLWPIERARSIISATAALADIFLPSLEDIVALSGATNPQEAMQGCLDAGATTVVLKLGSAGVLCHSAAGQFMLDAHQVNVLDATGAGDCFVGAFLARLTDGATLEAAVRYANAAAALTTTGFGAVAPIPVRDRVAQFMAYPIAKERS